MKIFPFQAIYPEMKLVASSDSFIKSVKNQYSKYKEKGFFKRSSVDALYVHEIIKNGRHYKGIVASADLEDYKEEKILIHEKTLAYKRQITMELILDREAIIKPILVAYDNTKAIDNLVNKIVKNQKPHFQVKLEDSGIEHRFYQISDGNQMQKLINQFAKIEEAYLADGHHRRAVFLNLQKSGKLTSLETNRKSLLTAFFPFSELDIHDFNRVVDVFDLMSPTRFIVELTKYFKIKILKSPAKPSSKFEIVVYINGEWILLKWKKEVLNQYKKQDVVLDAELLDKHVFNEILGIKDVKQTDKIKYIEGVKEEEVVINLVNSDFKKAAFFIYPVHKEELKKVAQQKLSLPPKSTWFEPRLKNGLISEEL